MTQQQQVEDLLASLGTYSKRDAQAGSDYYGGPECKTVIEFESDGDFGAYVHFYFNASGRLLNIIGGDWK